MGERSRSNSEIAQGAVPFPAARAPTTFGGTSAPSVSELCRDWLLADGRLEALTLEWSRAEADVLARREANGPSERMKTLDRRIRSIDRQRSGLLNRIVKKPAQHPGEVLAKLLVAKRLLEGEGGAEHDLVADAATGLANSTGF